MEFGMRGDNQGSLARHLASVRTVIKLMIYKLPYLPIQSCLCVYLSSHE